MQSGLVPAIMVEEPTQLETLIIRCRCLRGGLVKQKPSRTRGTACRVRLSPEDAASTFCLRRLPPPLGVLRNNQWTNGN